MIQRVVLPARSVTSAENEMIFPSEKPRSDSKSFALILTLISEPVDDRFTDDPIEVKSLTPILARTCAVPPTRVASLGISRTTLIARLLAFHLPATTGLPVVATDPT